MLMFDTIVNVLFTSIFNIMDEVEESHAGKTERFCCFGASLLCIRLDPGTIKIYFIYFNRIKAYYIIYGCSPQKNNTKKYVLI